MKLATFHAVLLLLFGSGYYFLTRNKSREPYRCPAPEDIQSKYVKERYQERKHVGFYYELAFKDITQPRGCKCITSNKTLVSKDTLRDEFDIQCAGGMYHSDLSCDLNVNPHRRGYMIGRWNNFSLAKGVTFPNTIVDVGVSKRSGVYDWVIEFQCKEETQLGRSWIQYYGLNFYSRTYQNQQSAVEEMMKSAREHGLGDFLDSGLDLYLVDHTDCLVNH